MKLLFACLCISSAAFAQIGGRTQALGGFRQAPALGGIYSSTATTRPLGGISSPGIQNRRNSRTLFGSYYGPIYYVPSASDYASADFWNSSYVPDALNAAAALQPAAQPQPIIINQYFDSKRPPEHADDTAPPVEDMTAAKPGDLLADPPNYYLIEYKDHTIYSALTYWMEGDTLHYVTTQNTHNQASLNLIDLDKTYKLNEDRSVPFTIAGK